MPVPRFEVAVGTIDGSNLTFAVSVAYQAGSLAVFLNGQLKDRSFMDGWTESSPHLGQFTMAEAPRVGDIVQAFFLDTTPLGPEAFVSAITGTLLPYGAITGGLQPRMSVYGALIPPAALTAMLQPQSSIQGSVTATGSLTGYLSTCLH
jgi:hypothetical protein